MQRKDSRKKIHVTRAQIAKAAGVAESVVSNALAGRPRVSEATRKRVQDIAAQLGYRPNYAARSLARGRSLQIGVVVPNLDNPHFARIVTGVECTAVDNGYKALIALAADNLQPIAFSLIESRIDACILATGHDIPAINPFIEQGIPLVTCGYHCGDGKEIPYVEPDFAAGAIKITEHLVSFGHREIGVVVGEKPMTGGRLEGAMNALRSHNIQEISVIQGGFQYEDGIRSLGEVILSRVTAVMMPNDYAAIGLVAAARQAGIRIPEDISIVGFDDVWVASHVNPTLTTIAADSYNMGVCAAECAIRLARESNGGNPHEDFTNSCLITAVHLSVRASTGPYRPLR